MKQIARIFGLLAALCAIPAAAQTQFPQTLPSNTVWGRSGISSGPGQAIPFPILTGNLLLAVSGDLTCASSGACTSIFTQSGAGAVQRNVDALLREKWPSLEDFGATCNGVTDDATALSHAEAAFSVVYLGPPASSAGTKCKVSTAASSITGRLFGQNAQLVDGSGNQRGYFFSAINANQPYTATNENTIDTAFNGNFTGSQFVVEHRITGAATLTQPTTGYVYSPWAYPYYTYVYNESGWNQSTSSNVGRTAMVAFRTPIYNHGQGDMVAYNCNGFVDTAKAGATSFLASPNVTCANGELFGGANGVFLNWSEMDLTDQGFDVAGITLATNLNRTNNTGAIGAVWGAFTVQSIGTKAIDFGMRMTGPIVTGIDMVNATLSANEAIALPASAKIDFNATANGIYKVTPSSTFMAFSSGNGLMLSDPTGVIYTPDGNPADKVLTIDNGGDIFISGEFVGLAIQLNTLTIANLNSFLTCNSSNVGTHSWVNNGIASPTYHQVVSTTGGATWPVACIFTGSGGSPANTYEWVYD